MSELRTAWQPPSKAAYPIDWQRYRVVAFESDDWGSCEAWPSGLDLADLPARSASPWNMGTLERAEDLAAMSRILTASRGADGLPACLTGFLCVANPDYDAIRAGGFQTYHEMPLDRGVPSRWRCDDPVMWRQAQATGTFAFEYHSRLHHTSPALWLARLQQNDAVGQRARQLFDKQCFAQGTHLPEYHGMTARQQHDWVRGGIEHFTRIVGHPPAAAVTSDATPVTEVVWATLGIRTFCLKNTRLNTGEVVAYHTKPWNAQDIYCPMGAHCPELDMVYLSRNVQFECALGPDRRHTPDDAMRAITAAWERGEPAILNTHRINYVSLDPQIARCGRVALADLLSRLANHPVHFLTTMEIGDLYRQGYSIRRIGHTRIVRNWREENLSLNLPDNTLAIIALPAGQPVPFDLKIPAKSIDLPPGNYQILTRPPTSRRKASSP